MVIVCPYCEHGLNVKTVREGRFTPRCSKCAKPFQVTITLDPEPKFTTAQLPEPAKAPAKETEPAPADDPNATTPPVNVSPEATSPPPPAALGATVAPETGAPANPDFSVAASIVVDPRAATSSPELRSKGLTDETAVEQENSAASLRKVAGANLHATEADVSLGAERPDCDDDEEVPLQLGNYQIIKELGRGGMGAVYLARQVSLDRSVALKVMNSEWASNPNFLARFTREAYAAAQLVHHNVVQVYDIGSDKGINYFSMEYVDGQSLGAMIKKDGKLPPDVAAGYVLQAARGLRFAHERGMIHRDVKPDNLMLNNQGVVKVADLGLVRTPGLAEESNGTAAADPAAKPGTRPSRSGLASVSNITLVNQAMGTPSFMSPEQARDSTKVDQRADIYSLGATLYVMVTGRPVFQGSNALEVMTKHATEPIARPDTVVKGVPRALGDIVVKMMAKKPDDRYPSMDSVIRALEDFLGLQASGKLAQSEQHLRTLENSVKAFHGAPAVQLRTWLLLGFFAACTVVFLLLLPLGRAWAWKTAGGILGLELMTAAAYFVVHGSAKRDYLFLKVRDLSLSASWRELARIGGCVLLFAFILYLVGMLLSWLLAAIVAVGLALALHYTVDRKIAVQRAAALDKVEHLLRTLRMRGLSEEALQEFVCRFSGNRWEEFFEAMFGYEAKLSARAAYYSGPKTRLPKYAGWRDQVIRWIDAYQRARQEARERQHLQQIEQNNLVAQGVDASQAKAQAERVAEVIVQKAAEIKQQEAAIKPPALDVTVAPEQAAHDATAARAAQAPPKRINVQEMVEVISEPMAMPARRRGGLGELIGFVFGGGVRFAVGAVLLVGCLFWLHSRHLLPGSTTLDDPLVYESIWKRAKSAAPLGTPASVQLTDRSVTALREENVPEEVTEKLAGLKEKEFKSRQEFIDELGKVLTQDELERFQRDILKVVEPPTAANAVLRALSSFNAGVAGILLILSAIWRSWKMGLLQLVAAAIIVIGPVAGAPGMGPLTPSLLSLATGFGLSVLAFFVGRDT
jgi:serine/threonine protein kinase